MTPIEKERLIHFLQGDPNIDGSGFNLDPEREHMLLLNSFTSGNYTRTGGTNWHDSIKHKLFPDDIEDVIIYPDNREEFDTMATIARLGKNYIQSGLNAKLDAGDDKEGRRKLDFIASEPKKDGSIKVTMTEKNATSHSFIVTEDAIRNFFYDHPIKGRFEIEGVMAGFEKTIINFCCAQYGEQLIRNDGSTETITSVYVDVKYEPAEDDKPKKEWTFVSVCDRDDINFAWGNEMRFCAFFRAFRMALVDGSRGKHYEWLYQAICYPAA